MYVFDVVTVFFNIKWVNDAVVFFVYLRTHFNSAFASPEHFTPSNIVS